MPGLGFKSFIQFGREATYGTGVAATNRLEIISWNVTPQIGVIRDPSLNNQASRRALYQGGLLYRGTFRTRLNYGGMLHFIDALFGTATYGSKGATVTGTGPYTHSFKELPILNSYTIEIGEGDIPVGKVQRLTGATIVGCTIRATAGTGEDAMLTAEWSVIATGYGTNLTPTAALSAPTIAPVLYHQAVIVDDGINTSGVRVRSFEVNLQNPVADDRFYLGSKNIDQVLRNDFLQPTMRLVFEMQDVSFYTQLAAFTAGSPELRFSDSTNFFRFRMAECNLVEFSNPVQGYGIVLSTAQWEGYRSGSNTDSSAMFWEVVNGEAGTVY